jgi:uncharacterized protein YecT (DUF1311 family)
MAELQLWSRQLPLPEQLHAGIAASPASGQVRDVADGIRGSFSQVASLLDIALRYRDAPPCAASTPSDELQYCLPNSLRSADAELNARYAQLQQQQVGKDGAALRSGQRDWIRARDKSCGVKELTGVTQAGWLASVLSNSGSAQCVLQHTRERLTALNAQ